MFERTREKDERRKYTNTYEDIARKIEAMKGFQPTGDGSGSKNAFFSVIKKDYPGHRRLYDSGVTTKVLNKGYAAVVPYVVSTEVIHKLSANMEAWNTEVADIKKELEADYH